jgi:hypothetical protein
MNERKYRRKSDAVPQGKGGVSGQDRERSKEVEGREGKARFSFVWRSLHKAVCSPSTQELWGATRYTNSKDPGSAALEEGRNL